MTTRVPDLVSIHFDRNEMEGWYSVVVRDRDGMLVCAGPLKVIDAWLKRNGYSYVEATDGWWRRN